jgi:hypothetical protein
MRSSTASLRPLAFALLLAGALAFAGSPAHAQEDSDDGLAGALGGVGEEYGRRYVQPLVNAAGADLNSGFFHKASVGGGLLPLVDVYVGVKTFGSLVPESDQSLSLRYQTQQEVTYDDGETYVADVTYDIDEAPTVFGEQEPGEVTSTATFQADGQERTQETSLDLLPGVYETSIVPLATPQVGVGLPMIGTHVSVRYLPSISYQNVGSLQFAGAGLRHDVSGYIPLLPLGLSAYGFYQNLSVEDDDAGEVLDLSAYALGMAASKSFLVATVYGGLQYERTTADVAYTFDPPGGTRSIAFGLTGASSFRALAGVSVGLGPAVLNVDLSQGERTVLSAGLGVSL